MATTNSSKKMNLKLVVDKGRNKVLYAEAGKDFVDFFFGLLELPLGAILNLLVHRGIVTSWPIANIYESVRTIDPVFLQPNQNKASLLSPKISCNSNTRQTPMMLQFGSIGQQLHSAFGAPLPTNKNIVDGYVKGLVTYMVMDDMIIKLMFTNQVKDIGCYEENIVEIDMRIALDMIKKSFESATVLTDVFLKNEDLWFNDAEWNMFERLNVGRG